MKARRCFTPRAAIPLLLVAALLAWAPRLAAEPLSGRVLVAGSATPAAWVGVRAAGQEVVTDEDGAFTFEDVPSGEVLVEVVDEGWSPLAQVVVVPVGGAGRVTLEVIPLYRSDLDVDVPADAARDIEQPGASTRLIDQAKIRAQPKRSAEDVLRLTPGILVVQHGNEGKGHQFFLRGFDAAHGSDIEVTLDGVPLNEASNVHGHGYLDIAFVLPEVIQSLETIKGPFDLEQGNFATAGSARFKLGVGEAYRGWTSGYQAGSTNRHRAFSIYAPTWAGDESFAGVEAVRDAGYGENRLTERVSGMAQWRLLDSAEAGQLDVMAAGYASRFGLPGALRAEDVDAGTIGFYDAYQDDTAGESRRVLLSARYERIGRDVALRGRVYGGARRLDLVEDFTGYLLNIKSGDRRHQRQDTLTLGGALGYERLLSPAWALKLGASWHLDAGEQDEENVDAAHRVLEQRRGLDYTQQQSSGWLGVEWRPLEEVRALVGVRGDALKVRAEDRLKGVDPVTDTFLLASPRLVLSASPAGGLTLYSAYGQGLRLPEARAVVPDPGTPEDTEVDLYKGGDAQITTSSSAELGLRWRPWSVATLSAAGFGTWISRESLFDHVSGINLEVNPTRRLGVELGLDVQPTRWLNLRADGTLVHARFIESGAPIPSAPWLLGSLEASATHPAGWRAGTRLLLLAPRPLPHGATTSTLVALDAAAGYRWGRFDLSLDVENLLDQRWREGEYHFASWWDQARPRSTLPSLHFVAGPPLTARVGVAVTF